MPKSCDSQPKGGLSPLSLISCNGKGVLCANETESILLSVLRPVLRVYRRGIKSILATQREQRKTSQGSADERMWQQQAHSERNAPSQAWTGTRWDVLGKIAIFSSLESVRRNNVLFFSGGFNFFKDNLLVDPKYWWPKDKTPVLLHPFPERKFPATLLLVVFALRPFTFY